MLSCKEQRKRTEALVDYIPENSELVVKIANLETTKSDFSNHHLYNQLNDAVLPMFFKSESDFLSQLRPKGESVLCFQKKMDSLREFTFITRKTDSVFEVDSLTNLSAVRQDYKGYSIKKLQFGNRPNYSAIVDSMFVSSSSEAILKGIIDNTTEVDATFKKAFSLNANDRLVSIIQPTAIIINDSLTLNLGTQAALEMELTPDGLSARGVLLDRDSLQLFSVFRGLQPRVNSAPSIIPVEAASGRAFTYDDAQVLESNLNTYHGESVSLDPIFGSINEVIGIEINREYAVALRSIDPEITMDEFKRFTETLESFREVTLHQYVGTDALFDPLYPLVNQINPNYAFEIEGFFVFSESLDASKAIISAFKNKAVLSSTSYFENAASQLSASSSFTIYDMQGTLGSWISPYLLAENSRVKKHPLIVMQYSYDRDFAHINLVSKETSSTQATSGVVSQEFAIQLPNTIMGRPQFFTNHRTRGMDIAVQDVKNKLYLIASNGKILWEKQLDGPILGSVDEVDLLRNGRKQLAFVTDESLYILDRNGKGVGSFPKKFKDKITQPLSIFDYDNKRNYRFVIAQGKNILMYDGKGKIVAGFTFKNTSSKVVLPPQHIRMGNKDYIVIAEENGKLNILSRVGKERVKVNKNFDFSEIPIAKEGLNFVVVTKGHSKESISQNGKVTSKSLSVSESYWLAIQGGTKVTLDDNLLRVNGKLLELPFGVYSQPRILISNRRTYVTITELQENKVFIFDKNAALLPGFPIYGSGLADIGDAQNNKKMNVVVKGSENELLLYSLD